MRLIGLISCAALAAGWVCAQSSDLLEIKGVVTELPHNQGVSGAQVTIREFAPDETATIVRKFIANVSTDGRGAFEFHAEHTGHYILTAKKDGYEGGAGDTYADLVEDQPRREYRFMMWRPGEITGRVIDEDGKPMAGLGIVMDSAPQLGFRNVVIGPTTTTDQDGLFTAEGLLPGEYPIEIWPKSVQPIVAPASEVDMNTVDQEVEAAYWPGVTDQQSASKILVTPGTSVDVGTIRVRKTSYYRLHVSVKGGVCAAGGKWTMLAINPDSALATMRGVTFPCMTEFVVRNLDPGSYWFLLADGPGANVNGAFKHFDTTSQNLDIALTLSNGGYVNGRVIAAEGATLPPLDKIQIGFPAENILPFTGDAKTVAPDSTGKFVLTNVQWPRHTLDVNGLSGDYYVKAIRFNGIPVVDNAVTLTQDAGASLLEIVIDDKPATISGTVTDGDKRAIRPIVVAVQWPLVSPNATMDAVGNAFQLAALVPEKRNSDDRGNFKLIGLAPGEYRVLALPGFDRPDIGFPNDDLLRLLNHAETVTLERGESKSMSLKLTEFAR